VEVVLTDGLASRSHAEIRWTERGWRLRDLGSTNGTWLNGVRLDDEEWPLRLRDLLQFAETAFRVVALEPGENGGADPEVLTEADWVSADADPARMLDVLRRLRSVDLSCQVKEGIELLAAENLLAAHEPCDVRRHVVDELAGNPFREARPLRDDILQWNDRVVVRVATAISEESDFSLMPVLADALEEGGCDDAELLAHCRGRQRHLRGCWALRAILGAVHAPSDVRSFLRPSFLRSSSSRDGRGNYTPNPFQADRRIYDLYRPGGINERKLRLFFCAVHRHELDRRAAADSPASHALEVAERFVDGLVGEDELRAASIHWSLSFAASGHDLLAAVDARERDYTEDELQMVCYPWEKRWIDTDLDILDDLLGPLPFRPVPMRPEWLTWNDGLAVKTARRIYEERSFGDLPALADALSAARCADRDILKHCRRTGGHWRGCWVLDLLLGKS
jgi:pSer/pThr/pTyr-binding forkhead associated (FHA) protein